MILSRLHTTIIPLVCIALVAGLTGVLLVVRSDAQQKTVTGVEQQQQDANTNAQDANQPQVFVLHRGQSQEMKELGITVSLQQLNIQDCEIKDENGAPMSPCPQPRGQAIINMRTQPPHPAPNQQENFFFTSIPGIQGGLGIVIQVLDITPDDGVHVAVRSSGKSIPEGAQPPLPTTSSTPSS